MPNNLPASTIILYQKFLEDGGYPRQFTFDDTRHYKAYLYLRDKVTLHIAHGGEVQLVSHPSGAAQWISANRNHEIKAHRGTITGVSGDEIMQLIPTDDEEEEENLVAEIKHPLVETSNEITSCISRTSKAN